MIRLLALAGGVAGGLAASQLPEFSQQYVQRLGGQGDALAAVVRAFDASAARAGLTREAALAELAGSPFRAAHRDDMRRTFERAARVEADLAALRAARPMERLLLVHRLRDAETLAATWADFRPAVPATAEGAVAAAGGFGAGWLAAAGLLALLAWPLRPRRARGGAA